MALQPIWERCRSDVLDADASLDVNGPSDDLDHDHQILNYLALVEYKHIDL